MKRKNLFNLLMILGLMLALGGSISMARQAQAQEPGPEGQSSIQAAVGTTFTYQGRLLDSDIPVDVACDFQFSLWTDFWTGSQVGSTQTKTNVDVADGYFSAPLDFGSGAFQGDARWLAISVACPTGGAYTPLSGRVALNAAPYAHSLRPGAVIEGSVSLGAVVKAENTYSGIFVNYGLHGVSQDTGVLGTGSNTGVKGETASTTGNGVYGEATASSGTTYGVYGKTNSPTGHGVYGTSPSTNVLYAGVTGVNTGGSGSGVYGGSSNGYGVYGKSATASGVGGISTSGHGVYGYSASGHAIYSDGDAHVEGDLTWKAKTSYVSVSTAAFIPESYNTSTYVDYQNEGYYLVNQDSGSQWFVAPVQLPHGATVTDLQVGWLDGSDVSATVYLRRRSMIDVTESGVTMAQVTSVGTFGTTQEGVWNDDTIDHATIDNEHYTYYLDVGMQDSAEDIKLYGVVIEYTITETY